MNEKLTGKELEAAIENRKAAMALARDAAIQGDPICGALFALQSYARQVPGGAYIETMLDYDDEDDEVRPY